ncbi:MAG: thermostable hemolysin delta-VPH [Clostridia bacterium]|nr:thermostable hemolysin delta-VPH [Clostridia bacterium]
MAYYNYHATAKRLIALGKLTRYYFVENYRGISPALLLFFDDPKHPIMPIRAHRFEEYLALLNK